MNDPCRQLRLALLMDSDSCESSGMKEAVTWSHTTLVRSTSYLAYELVPADEEAIPNTAQRYMVA
jgi:hypothetical protein